MADYNEEKIERRLHQFLSQERRKLGRGGCPDEESLVGYLEGLLAESAKVQRRR